MLFDHRQFFVKERVAVLKLTDTYEILDPAGGQMLGIARDQPAPWAKWLRLLVNKVLLPTAVNVYEQESMPPVLSLRKGPGFLHTKVTVTDAQGRTIGRMRSKLFSFGGGFHLLDPEGQRIGEVKGDWKGWNFKLLDASGIEVGVVTKKWAGIGRELFTNADQYMISIGDTAPRDKDRVALLLASALAIDIVFKEKE